jgi:hypothetical protein
MKHIRLFEGFSNIDSLCKKYGIKNYTIRDDGTVDVDGNVYLFNKELSKIPLKFGKVSGGFNCRHNQLTTLEGCPSEVGGDFDCYSNQLESLEGGPIEVGGHFNCGHNKLTTLEGGPSEIGGGFNCRHNQLTTLEGCPSEIGGGFNCRHNQLTTLEGCPSHVGGHFNCYVNPIYQVYKLFNDYKLFKYSLDYNYLRGTDIVKSRFKEACEETGIEIPDKIEGYRYI